ncbi:hypothetical protein Hanom_Chr01g00079581 [Helianthus anomalus]
MSLCEGLFKGVGMLQRVDDPRKENEGLNNDLKTSQTVSAELRCQWLRLSVNCRRRRCGAAVMLERKERAWEKEMAALVEEKEELAGELKHQRELDSVSQKHLDMMYAEYGMASDDNHRAYRDVAYQAGLKDGYAYSAQGLGKKETPPYISKAKKRLSKLDKEFGVRPLPFLKRSLSTP